MTAPLAALLSAVITCIAYLAAALTRGGAAAAWAVGTVVLIGTGWSGGATLIAFFVSATVVGRLARPAATGLDPKGERRDHWQVLANGGAAAMAATLELVQSGLGMWASSAAFAAAAADTWATSIGSRSSAPPRHLLTGRAVAPGTSGAVSAVGTSAALMGAVLVAGVAAAGTRLPTLLPVATLVGFVGMLVDSLLGATIQGRFSCPACCVPSEWPVHRCGSVTRHQGGLRWLTNDGVNALSTAIAALLGGLCWHALSR